MRAKQINIPMINLLILTLCPVLQAAEATVDDLIKNLQGPDARARALARQLLPYHGVDAVPAIMPLLAGKDPVVAQAAFDILADIGNQACRPGFEDQRRQVTDHLMALVQPNRSEKEKILGLRLLEVIAPAGSDLGPIADLLKNKSILRDQARVALQRMGTPEARTVLRAALKEAEPAFQCSLLNSLGEMKDAKSLDIIHKLCKSKDPAVRVAASRALSWTGNPAYLETIKNVAASADADTRFEAMEAWILLAEVIADQPARRNTAQKTYLEILKLGKGIEKIAALIGLKRVGDDSCAESIQAIIRDVDPRIKSLGDRVLKSISTNNPAENKPATRPSKDP